MWRLLTEIQTGTLEQTYLSPLPPWLTIAVGRIAAALVETTLVVTALYLATSAIVDLDITWHPQSSPRSPSPWSAEPATP